MMLHISDSHINFFQGNGFLEFEDALSSQEISLLHDAILSTLKKRSSQPLEELSPAALFSLGRDLSRDNSSLKEFVEKKKLAAAAAAVTQSPYLRFGYDQSFVTMENHLGMPFFDKGVLLNSISSIQPLLSCILICLKPTKDPAESFLPKKEGSILLFSPRKEMDFSPLFRRPSCYFMICYGAIKMRYSFNQDPNAFFLKKLGYENGDVLKDTTHPILFRGI